MFDILYLRNPDPNRVYFLWHFCTICGKTYSHSSNDFEKIKESNCCRENLRNVDTEVLFEPVLIIESNSGTPHLVSTINVTRYREK